MSVNFFKLNMTVLCRFATERDLTVGYADTFHKGKARALRAIQNSVCAYLVGKNIFTVISR